MDFQQLGKKTMQKDLKCGYLKTQPPKIFPAGLCPDAKSRWNK